MTASPKLSILDVGHGNCAILEGTDGTLIIDAGVGSTLNDYLDDSKISDVAALLISHSDADHLAGAINVLVAPQFRVRAVYLNSDAAKTSDVFRAFRSALEQSRSNSGTEIHVQLTTTLSTKISLSSIVIEILSPSPIDALVGPGGKDLQNKRITANGMSVVLRLLHEGRPFALLPADLDKAGFDRLIAEKVSLEAPVLVYPHHGGKSSGSDQELAKALCDAVQPNLVVFSIGRGKHSTPLPSIVTSVTAALPKAHIACTQLSKHCAAVDEPRDHSHLSGIPAAGKAMGKCCAGSIEVMLSQPMVTRPILDEHAAFIKANVPTPLCKQST